MQEEGPDESADEMVDEYLCAKMHLVSLLSSSLLVNILLPVHPEPLSAASGVVSKGALHSSLEDIQEPRKKNTGDVEHCTASGIEPFCTTSAY